MRYHGYQFRNNIMKLLLASRHSAHGFTTPLELEVDHNESLKSVIKNLNKYRSPDNQIKQLQTASGDPISLLTKITSDTQLYVD